MENNIRKFSTFALILALCAFALPNVSAAKKMHAQTKSCHFLANAPDQHVVVRGDTLWGISQKFLEHAWCWPEVWGMNREEIKNPHWIYPGQIVYFDRAAGQLRLGKPVRSGGLPEVRLSPQIRRESLNAITTIPANAIEPFLAQPVVFDNDELANAPHVVSAGRNHLISGGMVKVYVRGELNGVTDFQLYRPSTPLIDPITKQLLGFESAYVGSVKLIRAGEEPDEAHTFLVTKAKEEVTAGDKLLSVPVSEMNNYVPHPPEGFVTGHIVSIYGGVAQAGHNQTVAINLGAKDGMNIGTVLQLYRSGKTIKDETQDNSPVRLPDEEYGTLFIYRVFNNVSYGLIMAVSETTNVGDAVKSPE